MITERDEYCEVGENFRSGYKLISEVVKAFIAFNGFLFTAVGFIEAYGGEEVSSGAAQTSRPSLAAILLVVLGLLSCAVAWIAHRRIGLYVRRWLARGRNIERTLGSSDDDDRRLYGETYLIEIEDRNRFLNNYKLPQYGYALVVGLLASVLIVYIRSRRDKDLLMALAGVAVNVR